MRIENDEYYTHLVVEKNFPKKLKNREEKRVQDLNNLWHEINDFSYSIRLNNEYPLINQHFPNLIQKVIISEEDLTDDDN